MLKSGTGELTGDTVIRIENAGPQISAKGRTVTPEQALHTASTLLSTASGQMDPHANAVWASTDTTSIDWAYPT